MTSHTLKRTLYEILEETGQRRPVARVVRLWLIALILLNIVLAVLETVPEIRAASGGSLRFLQLGSGFVFLVEYVLRLYVADMHPPLRRYGPLKSRLLYAVHPDAIIDLLAALPLLLVLALPTQAVTVVVILRLLRFLKLARYSPALRSLISAIAGERRALLGSAMIIGGVVLLAATVMYLIEHEAQPDKFRSILSGIYWAITTVTTVGYGDVVPQTNLGKSVSAAVMVMGYLLIALPVGIIASAFAREIHSRDFVVTWSMVARVPLFEELKAAQIAEVASLLQSQRVRSGTVIAARGDVADRMFFISDGTVEIQAERDSVLLGEGKFFGELALINQRIRTMNMVAASDCQLLVLEVGALRHLMDKDPDLGRLILTEAEEMAAEGRRILGELAEQELADSPVLPDGKDNGDLEPELFKRDGE